MKTLITVLVALVLFGCSGEAFTGFTTGDPSSADADLTPADGGLNAAGGSGGALEEDGGPGSGGIKGSGGAIVATGGSTVEGSGGATSTGGSTAAGSGGSPSTGGMLGAGGVTATGGTTACTLVTHHNGLGQTWQDCAALGTYNEKQALAACEAYLPHAPPCSYITRCLPGSAGLCSGSVTFVSQCGGYEISWSYAGQNAAVGHVGTMTACATPQDSTWN